MSLVNGFSDQKPECGEQLFIFLARVSQRFSWNCLQTAARPIRQPP